MVLLEGNFNGYLSGNKYAQLDEKNSMHKQKLVAY